MYFICKLVVKLSRNFILSLQQRADELGLIADHHIDKHDYEIDLLVMMLEVFSNDRDYLPLGKRS